MTWGRGRKSRCVAGILALLAQPAAAPAETPAGAQGASDSKKACIVQHEAAQTFRRTGKLLEARDAALVCSRDECPGAVRADCVDWLDSVTKTIPSLVVRAKSDDRDVFDARVSIDGKAVISHLDGTSFELNPGAHVLRVEYSNFDPIQQEILVLEGEKNRVVVANFVKAAPVSKEPPGQPSEREAPLTVETYRPTPVLTYVFGGLALAGGAGFAAFALSGQNEKKALESSCRPVCSDNDLESARARFIMADASLGIAIASALAAGIVYFTRPTVPLPVSSSQGKAARPASPIALGFSPTASGAHFAAQTEF